MDMSYLDASQCSEFTKELCIGKEYILRLQVMKRIAAILQLNTGKNLGTNSFYLDS